MLPGSVIRRIALGALVILGLSALGAREWALLPDGHTHLAFLDIGQGDSELIRTAGGHTIIVDGGPDLATLEHLGSRLPFFNRTIDLLVVTHTHQDHLASFPEILRRYHVDNVLLTGGADDLPRYQHMLEEITALHTHVTIAEAGKQIAFDDGTNLAVLWPPKHSVGVQYATPHDGSIVLRLTAGAHSALLTGDLEARNERRLIAMHAPLQADILKVGHHGSLTSSTVEFLKAVRPKLAVISAGKGNRYGLPKPAIVERFHALGIPLKRTDQDGTVEVMWE